MKRSSKNRKFNLKKLIFNLSIPALVTTLLQVYGYNYYPYWDATAACIVGILIFIVGWFFCSYCDIKDFEFRR